jgi:hypothetical protein
MSFTEIAPQYLLPDKVWQRVKSAIPVPPPKPKGATADGRSSSAECHLLRAANWDSVKGITPLLRRTQYGA